MKKNKKLVDEQLIVGGMIQTMEGVVSSVSAVSSMGVSVGRRAWKIPFIESATAVDAGNSTDRDGKKKRVAE